MAVQATQKLDDLQVVELEEFVKKGIEMFQKDHEFYDKYCNHIGWDAKAKEMTVRRVIKPKVTVAPTVAVEDIAPRPEQIAVERFRRRVNDYRNRINYTAEEVEYGYDDIKKIAVETLGDITTQHLDFIKGDPFFKSPCVVTYDTSILNTLAKIGIILKKNKARYYEDNKFACMLTPEDMEKLRVEVEGKGVVLAETTKEELAKTGAIAKYGKWLFIENGHDLMYDMANGKTNMVCFGRRPDGTLPVDCAMKHKVDVIYNELGTGVMTDVDGNITDDANNQRGSIAVNVIGLGAYINDDLCIINCELTTTAIELKIAEVEKTGFDALAPQDVNVTFVGTTNVGADLYGVTATTTSGLYKATANTVIKVVAKGLNSKTLTDMATTDWALTATSGTLADAKVLKYAKTNVANDTVYIELFNNPVAITITTTKTLS